MNESTAARGGIGRLLMRTFLRLTFLTSRRMSRGNRKRPRFGAPSLIRKISSGSIRSADGGVENTAMPAINASDRKAAVNSLLMSLWENP